MTLDPGYIKIRVTNPPPRDPKSGGPALTTDKVYAARVRPSGFVTVRDDEDFPVVLEPERFELVDSES